MVLAGNIGRLSLMFRQPREGLSLQNEAPRDDNLDGFCQGTTKVFSAGPERHLYPESAKYEVTIYLESSTTLAAKEGC